MISFDDFLKKEKKIWIDGEVKGLEPIISVRALGEWALNEMKESEIAMNSYKPHSKDWCNIHVYYGANETIAIACLGEQEVQKRLEAKK